MSVDVIIKLQMTDYEFRRQFRKLLTQIEEMQLEGRTRFNFKTRDDDDDDEVEELDLDEDGDDDDDDDVEPAKHPARRRGGFSAESLDKRRKERAKKRMKSKTMVVTAELACFLFLRNGCAEENEYLTTDTLSTLLKNEYNFSTSAAARGLTSLVHGGFVRRKEGKAFLTRKGLRLPLKMAKLNLGGIRTGTGPTIEVNDEMPATRQALPKGETSNKPEEV